MPENIADWHELPAVALSETSGHGIGSVLDCILLDSATSIGSRFAAKNMRCPLTNLAVVFSLLVEAAFGQSTEKISPAGEKSLSRRATTHSVQWEQLPLGAAIKRLNTLSGNRLLLDRRVDPNQLVNLSLPHATVEEIVAELANACTLGYTRWEHLFYLGPPQTAAHLKALAAQHRKDVAALPADQRQSLLERRRIVWPRLTEPRGLVVHLMEDHGWRVEHGAQIPHDLWSEGELPPLALSDQLTLLLAGFDLSYRIFPERHAIEIIPIDWGQIRPAPHESTATKRLKQPTAGGQQVFTLRVEHQPVGRVLEQLGRRLGWKLTVDEAAIRAAGRSLDEQVSFAVENVDADQLLAALLAPVGLKAERNGDRISVTAR